MYKGTIKLIVKGRNFGFIKANGGEYFFHRDDFNGHWDDLEADASNRPNGSIPVEFEISEQSSKGPRAEKVRRTDFPNQVG